eukprot:CAMPEP_0119283282 /NCGR_PEP_ID=MMETSP1329-20130426/28231_1 /TAXON_ID=114041 /ORGANISM="Genus nov. species nov., Strain RCC1024" /LENGTH=387 /DNA_ID=CAMNT_0007283953 /DNA_START=386 /DNA_END=1546 /DNA_ORIENTATION=+
MLQSMQRKAESQLRRRPKRHRSWRRMRDKCAASKVMSMVWNLVGAIGCILGNKHVMTHHARAPLTLTFLGYALIVLAFAACKKRQAPDAFADLESGASSPRRPSADRRTIIALVLLTATAPALANASLLFNSVGFTQLSKVLTTPAIAAIEWTRGHAAPMNTPRLLCLAAIHVGVYVASVADVTLNRTGMLVAAANVVVTARYKTEWSRASRVAIAHRRSSRGPIAAAAEALEERAAVQELVEATLPWAALALVPAIAYFESAQLMRIFRTFDAGMYLRLLGIAIMGAWTSSTGYMVIGRLSALTHQVLGQFKMACLLLGSYLVLGADLNAQQVGGAGFTMLAILAYTRATVAQRNALLKRDRGDRAGAPPPPDREPLISPGARSRK